MFKAGISSALKEAISRSGLLPYWEDKITPWPRALLYHCVGHPQSVPFLAEMTLSRDDFLRHISMLRKRYRFLSWAEYKEALVNPGEAKRCLLLTFDDGFQSSWSAISDLAADHQIPALFFVNTRVLDNAYTPWHIQYQFLRHQSKGAFLAPLWRSISKGQALAPNAARKTMHERFGLKSVVEPLAEGMASFGITPAELAQRYQLYVTSGQLQQGRDLIEIGNHSHSHHILSKLTSAELEEDLRVSHQLLQKVTQREPEAFAYPFGIPGEHFNHECEKALRQVGSYPYIFSAADISSPGELGRICLDKVALSQINAVAAKVTPRALKQLL